MFATACAGAFAGRARHAGDDEASAGDPNAPPSLAILPAMVRKPADMTERAHSGLVLAAEIFERKLPEPPADRSYTSLSAWVEQAVAPWIEQRRDAIDETRFQLLDDDPQAADQVIAGAVVGLLHEDTANELERIPAPAELDEEPDVATMFHDVIRVQAKPFVGAALHAYRDCSRTGEADNEELTRWARFCRARFQRLQLAYGDKRPAPPSKH